MNLSIHQIEQVLIVKISGRIDIESAQKFQSISSNHFENVRVIIDCSELSFVGSTGISLMIESLSTIIKESPQTVRISGLSNEFAQILWTLVPDLHLFQSSEEAIQSLNATSSVQRDSFEAFASLENPD